MRKNELRFPAATTSFDRAPFHRWLLLACLSGGFGCQAVQNRMVQRSEHCGELCARAREARENGDADQANRCINEALRQRPNDVESRRNLAETMWSSGRQDEAISQYLTLCEDRPSEVKLAERLAVMQWEANHRFAAANTALSVLRLDPHSKEALRIKARNDVVQGKLDEALTSYIKLSQIDPADPVTLKELGELHLKRGQPERACPLFRTALQQPQTGPEQRADIEWQLGVALAACERWSMAVEILERAICSRPSTANDWLLLAKAHFQAGNVDGARADVKQAQLSDPKSEEARNLSQQFDAAAESPFEGRPIVPVSYRPN